MDQEPIKRTPLTATGFATMHPKRQNISFGRWAMPVMAEKMQDPDPLDRKRALQSLSDYVFDSRRVASKEFATTAAGRLTFEKHDFYNPALKLVEDEDEIIRKAAYTAIERVSLSPVGAESLVHAGAIEVLFRRIRDESDANVVILLQAMHNCCRLNFEKALNVDGLKILIPLLKNLYPEIRRLTASIIMDLSIEKEGREQAVELSAISPLTELCLDEDNSVKAKALAALMMICITTSGKYKVLEDGTLEHIIHLVKSDCVEVRLNAIKVLTCLGEAPEGRKELLKYYRMLLRVLNDDYEEVRNAMRILIDVVTFKP